MLGQVDPLPRGPEGVVVPALLRRSHAGAPTPQVGEQLVADLVGELGVLATPAAAPDDQVALVVGTGPAQRSVSSAQSAAPTMPARLRSSAATFGVFTSMRGMNWSPSLLTPPPITKSSGEKSFSSVR